MKPSTLTAFGGFGRTASGKHLRERPTDRRVPARRSLTSLRALANLHPLQKMNPPITWIESTSWEPAFFGLPQRIPWPSDTDPAGANRAPFEMEHMLRAIKSLGSEAVEPWISFSKAAVHLEDLAEAIEDSDLVQVNGILDEFESAHPGTAFVLFHRGNLARLEGREDDAAKLFREALERAPRSAPIWNNLGVLHAMKGERDEAIAAFHKTLEAMPQDRTALEGLAQLRALVKLLRNPQDPNSATYVDLPTFDKIVASQLEQAAPWSDQRPPVHA